MQRNAGAKRNHAQISAILLRFHVDIDNRSQTSIGVVSATSPTLFCGRVGLNMPINKIFWSSSSNSSCDIHVLRGQSTRDLTTLDLRIERPGPPPTNQFAATYLNNNTDVSPAFIPLFSGTLVSPTFVGTGNGITVDTRTGAVTVTAGTPAHRKNNFIIEVAARNMGNPVPLTEVIRVQIHNSVTNVWLSPDRLTVRPTVLRTLPENCLRKSCHGQQNASSYTRGS